MFRTLPMSGRGPDGYPLDVHPAKLPLPPQDPVWTGRAAAATRSRSAPRCWRTRRRSAVCRISREITPELRRALRAQAQGRRLHLMAAACPRSTRRSLAAGVAVLGARASPSRTRLGRAQDPDLRHARRQATCCSTSILPQGARAAGCRSIVFLHGGGWSGGTRTTGPDFRRFFAQDGFAMASIEYRLTPAVTFPANAEDVKTAVRWLRANAGAHGLDPARICLWGTSAGGHLAAVAGLAPRGTFEGADNLNQSSAVQCVLDAYGPTLFTPMDAQTEQRRPRCSRWPRRCSGTADAWRGRRASGAVTRQRAGRCARGGGAPGPPVAAAAAGHAARRAHVTGIAAGRRAVRPCPTASAPPAR